MSTLLNLLMIVQILSALGMIGLILIQHGKGADMGVVCTLAQAYFGNLRAAPSSEGSVLERSQPAVPPTAADLVPGVNPTAVPASPAATPAPAVPSSPASQIPGK